MIEPLIQIKANITYNKNNKLVNDTGNLISFDNKFVIKTLVELKADVNYRDSVIADDNDNVKFKYDSSKPDNLGTINITTLPLYIIRNNSSDFRYDTIKNTITEILLNTKADINTYIHTDNNVTFNILSHLINNKSIYDLILLNNLINHDADPNIQVDKTIDTIYVSPLHAAVNDFGELHKQSPDMNFIRFSKSIIDELVKKR